MIHCPKYIKSPLSAKDRLVSCRYRLGIVCLANGSKRNHRPGYTGWLPPAFHQVLHDQLSVQQSIALSQSYALSGLGGILIPSEAKEMFDHMLTGAQHIQAPELIARAFFGLARVAAEQNSWDKARSFAQESLELYTKLGDAQREHVSQWLDTFSSSTLEL